MVVTAQADRLYAWTRRGRDVWFFGFHEGQGWRWGALPRPGEHLGGLAAVGNDLFALVYSDVSIPPGSSSIIRYNTAYSRWDPVFSNPHFAIQSLHYAGDRLFAAAYRRTDLNHHYILSFDPTHSSHPDPVIKQGNYTIALSGVTETAGGDIYLATERAGIFRFDEGLYEGLLTERTPDAAPPAFVVTGIIATGDDIVVAGATANGGALHIFRGGLGSPPEISHHSEFFNGGMGVWRRHAAASGWQPALLLLGVRTNGRFHGYREIELLPNGNVAPSPILWEPGSLGADSSVNSVTLYRGSIRHRSVRHIRQAPPLYDTNAGEEPVSLFPDMTVEGNAGWQPPIFASTSINGLWVYDSSTDRWGEEDNRRSW